jgi:uncharacterized protein (TIGR03000 family)
VYSMVLMAALATGGESPEWFGCHGCCGCWGGWGCCGCWGGCYGCYGCCGGCWGGCYGCGGCWGCWGGYSAWSYGCYSNGCCGGMYYGGYYGGTVAPGAAMPGYGAPEGVAPGSEPLPAPKPDKEKMTVAPNKAKLIVELPADAKLYVDDRPMKTTSKVRTFSTPTLEPGQLYYYELRVEVLREGKPVTETKRVIIKAGEVVRASFPKVEAESVAAVKAR